MSGPNWAQPFCDFPTAWWIQDQGLIHTDERCSAVQSPAFLCDCGAVLAEWQRRHDLVAASSTPTGGGTQ